jgi:branched-chain amino acid transport system substrate-binding protein
MKRIIFLIVLIAILSTSIFPQTNENVRVGVFADLTGQTSSFGEATRNGILLATEEINKSGGIDGRKIELLIEDDEGRPETARNVVRRLIYNNEVHAILGEVASTISLAAAPFAQEAKIPMIAPAATNPKVTAVGDYIFRTCFIDPLQGTAMAKFAFNELKARRVAILSDEVSDYSTALNGTFTETFTKLGGKIVARETYYQTDPDFREQLTKIRALKPDAVYLSGYYGQTGVIARQARRLKMTMPLLGGDGWDSPELWKLGGNALKNTYVTNHFAGDNPAREVRDFITKYKARFGVDPDSLAALGYDAVYVLADAIRRAKTTDGAKLRDAIARTRNFSGVTGKIIALDQDRNPEKPVVILSLNPETRKFVFRSTVAP